MSPESSSHDRDYLELVLLHALQALPASEVPVVEAHISGCTECRREMEALRPIIAGFVSWPTDVLRPSTSLWERLARRIAAETGQAPVVPAPRRRAEPEWEEVAPGISCKLLATDTEQDRVSMLVRLAPGAAYPPHRHAGSACLERDRLHVRSPHLHPRRASLKGGHTGLALAWTPPRSRAIVDDLAPEPVGVIGKARGRYAEHFKARRRGGTRPRGDLPF